MCVCVCVCVRACACVRAHACVCIIYILCSCFVISIHLIAVRQGGRDLQKLTGQQRANIISRLASLLLEKEEEILAANKTDIALAQQSLTPSLLARLKLSSAKLKTLADGLSAIAEVRI